MKTLLLTLAVLISASSAFAGDVYVKGHMRDTNGDGVKDTYVNPYYRTAPDSRSDNNYSTDGNYNPYTGQQGTERPRENDSTYQPYTNPYSTPRSKY